MSFQPIIPQAGFAGWRFLQRTLDMQMSTFAKRPELGRDTDYFEARIGSINSAEELVADRRLLRVALGAFGLQDDINNRFLIRKVLEGGVMQQDSLANKLGDQRYRDMPKAFGFGDLAVPSSKLSDFGPRITASYRRQQFEVAVGDQDQSMRVALSATRDLAALAASDDTDKTKWFQIMGRPSLRKVFETAFGLPKDFARLDLERQLGVFQDRARSQLKLNAVSDLTDPLLRDKLVQRYLLRSEFAQQSSVGSASVALSLLMNIRR